MEREDVKVVLSGTYEGSYSKFRNNNFIPKNRKNKLKFIKLLLKKIKGDKL
jgi:hypothetical protein